MKTTAVFFYMTFVFSICISSAQGQIPILESEAILDKLRLNKGINGVETLQYSNLSGDPYLFKDFKKGKLVVLSGAKFDVTIRYDIYANEMHLQNKGEIFAIIHIHNLTHQINCISWSVFLRNEYFLTLGCISSQ